MSKKRAGAAFIVFLTCGLITQAFAQGQELKFNSNADDIRKIGNLVEEFRQDIIHKDPYSVTKLMLYPNVLFHSIDNQESVDNARKHNAQVRREVNEFADDDKTKGALGIRDLRLSSAQEQVNPGEL